VKRPSWALQLVRIYEKGIEAYKQGQGIDSCPYLGGERGHGISTNGGNLQEQRARYWCDGWRKAAQEQEAD